MRLQSLKHLVAAVVALARPTEVTVLGSSALLACDPSLGEPGQPLETSLDADLLVEPCDEGSAKVLDEAVGEGSMFHKQYGVYADLMRPEIEETLPSGWRSRRLSISEAPGVRCLDPYDLAIVKLSLGRAKDMELLMTLVRNGVIDVKKLRTLYRATPMDEATMFKAGRNLGMLDKDGKNHEAS